MSPLHSPNLQYPEVDFNKKQDFMDSSNRFHPQNQLVNSGLSRYRSAPSSFLESLVNNSNSNINGNDEDFRYFRSTSPEPDNFVPEYMLPSNNFGEYDACRHQFEGNTVKQEDTTDISVTQQQSNNNNNNNNNNGYTNGNGSSSQQMIYQIMQIRENDNSFGAANSAGNTRNGTNLVRQNSSPAGLFSNLGVDNGFRVIRDTGCFRAANGGSNGGATSSTTRLNNHLNLLSRQSSGILPQISEIGPEKPFASTQKYASNFGSDSWDNNSIIGHKRARDDDGNIFFGINTVENQNGGSMNRSTNGLTHQLSLPLEFGEIGVVEKFMQFQGSSVPCKIRAKRGFATHPRSIAERVRRTRISERIKKLQELFPDLDKQTSTADMLDMAVEHIKDLQNQVQTLRDGKEKCMCCCSKQNQHPNTCA